MNTLGITLGSAFLAVAAATANAQALRVQSGEHPAFTRIVVPWPDGRNWNATRSQTEVRLELDGHSGGFNFDSVFSRIPRQRVGNLAGEDGTMSISINCECDVAAFSNGKGYVVIDVTDPGRSVVPPIELRSEIEVVEPTSAAVDQQVEPVSLPLFAELFQRRQSDETEPPAPVKKQAEKSTGVKSDPFALDIPSADQLAILNELQQRLAEEVGAATTRGLLDPTQEGLPFLPSLQDSRTDLSTEDLPIIDQPLQIESQGNLRITTSRDIPLQSSQRDALSISEGVVCPTDQAAMVENWGDDRPFGVQISELREALYGEFDRLDAGALEDLVQLYVYFGFGAEAVQLLRSYPDTLDNVTILFGIATIMEKGHLQDNSPLSALSDCDSNVALWAILAPKEIGEGTHINKAAALRALNRLPLHLRSFLAPELSNRLLNFGDANGAATAMRSVERAPKEIDPEGTLALASIALENGETDRAKDKFEKVVNANTVPSPEALLALVNEQLKADQPISYETALLVEAYAQELRDSSLGPELGKAHILSLTRSGQYDKAFQAYETLNHETASATLNDTFNRLVNELTSSASDIVFLDHAFQLSDSEIDSLPSETQMALTDRFLSLGFAGPAQRVLSFLPDRPTSTKRQLLAARVALELNQINQSVAVLIGIEGTEADQIRAEAALQSGAEDEATVLFEKANQPDAARQTAWLSESWAELTSEETPVFGPMVQLATADTDVALVAEGMLTRTSSAIDESTTARETIAALLEALSIDDTQQLPPEQ